MTTFFPLILATFCIFLSVHRAFSQQYYEALVVITNSSSPSGISLPNEAEESEGQIIYPDKAEDGSKIEYSDLCPLETNDVVKDVDRELKFSLEKSTPMKEPTKCSAEVKPILTKHRNPQSHTTQCGKSPDHIKYNFGFSYFSLVKNPLADKPEQERRITTLSLYDICYNKKEFKTLWTKHRLETVSMLKHNKGKGFISQQIPSSYTFSTENYALPDKTFLNMKTEYEEQDDSYKMVPQMLVPEEDLALKLWKKTTTHMMNTAPLWEKLVPLMRVINDGIRKAGIAASIKTRNSDSNLSDTLHIYTTASPFFFKNELGDLPRTADLSNISQFGLNIWCKFIHNESENTGVMIYLHNLPGVPPKEIDEWEEKINTVPEKINTVSEKVDATTAKIDTTLEKIDTTSTKIDTTSNDLKFDIDKNVVLKDTECEKQVPCNFRNWSNNQTDLLDDILNYAYCCEVNNEKVEELFNIKINKKLELFDIDSFINGKSI